MFNQKKSARALLISAFALAAVVLSTCGNFLNDAVHKIEDDKFANAPPWGVAYRAAANKYYPSLHEAFAEVPLTGTSLASPDVITVLYVCQRQPYAGRERVGAAYT